MTDPKIKYFCCTDKLFIPLNLRMGARKLLIWIYMGMWIPSGK